MNEFCSYEIFYIIFRVLSTSYIMQNFNYLEYIYIYGQTNLNKALITPNMQRAENKQIIILNIILFLILDNAYLIDNFLKDITLVNLK